jgi:GH24 family phage-related lysozyme (muramidase)
MISIIKRTIELVKEFGTLRSPAEAYIFAAGVWFVGYGIGSLLG